MNDHRERRSLTQVGGETRLRGQPIYAELLAHALDVESSVSEDARAAPGDAPSGEASPAEQAARAHVHGFHTYPARMHPTTAARLVLGLSRRGDTVLDPFCGSGTVVVEARRAARHAVGVDLNPLAVRLARRKVEPALEPFRLRLVARAHAIGELATSRRKARVGASRRYPDDDVESFDPHVLLELDGLRVGVEEETDPALRATLELVLSSILVKLSRRVSDTSAARRPTRIAAGFPTKSFVRKAEELARRLEEVEPELRRGPPAQIFEGDARMLAGVDLDSVDLVVTSPPYAGVYDYVEHHRLRLRWLGLSTKNFEDLEIGAKRRARDLDPPAARERYLRETVSALRAVHRVLRAGGKCAWLVADGTAGGRALPADALVEEAASIVGLDLLAVASQARPHFDAETRGAFSSRSRYEHVVLLQKPTGPRGAATRADGGDTTEGSHEHGRSERQERGARGQRIRGEERPAEAATRPPRGPRHRRPRGV